MHNRGEAILWLAKAIYKLAKAGHIEALKIVVEALLKLLERGDHDHGATHGTVTLSEPELQPEII